MGTVVAGALSRCWADQSALRQGKGFAMSDELAALSKTGVSTWLDDLSRKGWCRAAWLTWPPVIKWRG